MLAIFIMARSQCENENENSFKMVVGHHLGKNKMKNRVFQPTLTNKAVSMLSSYQ